MTHSKYAIRTIVCKGCQKTVTDHLRPNQEYCSHECYARQPKPKRKTGKTIVCAICGKDFYIVKWRKDNARFCSVECANEWQSRNKMLFTCKTCGKTFLWSPSRAKTNKVTYCSLACRDKDPDRKEMLLQMNAKQQEISPNRLERAGFLILDSIGIPYERQYTVNGKFTVDAFIPSVNMAIQFDGDYWHGHPAKFATLDKRQAKRRALDTSQDAYMRQCGMKIIRFWESDVFHNPELVKQTIVQAIA